jgi:hypothetical protein
MFPQMIVIPIVGIYKLHIYMNVLIMIEPAQFPFWKYFFPIFVLVSLLCNWETIFYCYISEGGPIVGIHI